MKRVLLSAPSLISCLALASGCGKETPTHESEAVHVELGRGLVPPSAQQTVIQWPVSPPRLSDPPAPAVVELRPKPELDPRRQALAEIGTKAFEALKTGYLDDLIALTPQDDNSALAEICPDTERLLRREVEARFDHCHQIIDWDAVDRADVFTGELVAEQATGCTAGISDYGRLQLYLHMNHGKIWQVDFLGAVGRDQQTLGINGQVVCRMVEDAPGPK